MSNIWLETRRQAAAIGGRARTERKANAARENGKRGGRPVDPDSRRQRILALVHLGRYPKTQA